MELPSLAYQHLAHLCLFLEVVCLFLPDFLSGHVRLSVEVRVSSQFDHKFESHLSSLGVKSFGSGHSQEPHADVLQAQQSKSMTRPAELHALGCR